MTKLERALEVVGESDPTYPGLVDALKRVRPSSSAPRRRPNLSDRIFHRTSKEACREGKEGGRKSKGRVGQSRGTTGLGRRVFA